MARVLQENRKAFYDYDIKEEYEAGIKLTGAEVKSVKNGGANLRGSYVMVDKDEVPLVVGMHILRYNKDSSREPYDAERSRRLLLHKKEIRRIMGLVNQKRFTAIPLRLKFVKDMIKLDIGVGVSKRKVDKREEERRKDIDRTIQRTLKRG